MLVFRLALVVAIFVAANLLAFGVPQSAAAARVSGEAYGVGVGRPPVAVPNSAYVQLPPEGGNVADSSPGAGYGVGNSGASTTQINTSTVGDAGAGTVTSTSAMTDGGRASTSATVTYGSLIVAGLSYPNPSINQRIEIPGVGFVMVNEQIVGGDGRESASVVARAAHLTITAPSLLDLPQGTELILAHAAAGVPDIAASRAVAPAPTATATDVPWAPISPFQPIDTSLNGNFDSNSNGNDNFGIDTNGNDNVRPTATSSATPIRPTSTQLTVNVNITVVVVDATATPTATKTP